LYINFKEQKDTLDEIEIGQVYSFDGKDNGIKGLRLIKRIISSLLFDKSIKYLA